MSLADKQKWNEKFTKKSELLKPREASAHVQKYVTLARGRKALDLACGAGRHALYLESVGFEVDALDISEVAIDALKEIVDTNFLTSLHVRVFDLDEFKPDKADYDVIIMSNYLDRELIYRASRTLQVEGIFIIETYMDDSANEKKDSNKNSLLQPRELMNFFDDRFEVLHYAEFDNESYEIYRMKKQVIVVQKIN